VLDGALKLIVACPMLDVAVTPVGTPGIVEGVTEFDIDDAAPTPCPFVAVTVNVYAVPLLNPVTVIGLPVEVALYVSVPSMTV
jgi:hypothetical protein